MTDIDTDDDEGQPIHYTVLPRGVPVIATDGVEVGTVHRSLDNAREHIFDGIEITTPEGRRFVDAPEVARITDRRVTLTIDSAAVAELPSQEGGTAGSATPGWLRRLSRKLGR